MPTSIETLKLDNNKFTGGIPSEWGSLTNLKSLEMYSCGIGGAWVCRDVPSYHHPRKPIANLPLVPRAVAEGDADFA